MDGSKLITFRASFPAIQSAIKRDGSGGGMRIQLDIPESEMPQAVLLLAMMQERLIITVDIEDNGQAEPQDGNQSDTGDVGSPTPRRRSAKRRK